MSKTTSLFAHLKSDFAAGLVVFLVALPLCLGIALASGAPLFSGIISGVVGGIVVAAISNSPLSVSGPAAGLTAIVFAAIHDLGSLPLFFAAVVLAGIFQVLLGFLRAGTLSNYFPNNVIEGMLAGIGVIIFLKQLPHAFGYDPDFEGDEAFLQNDGQNTLSELWALHQHIEPGALLIAILSLGILLGWPKLKGCKKYLLCLPLSLQSLWVLYSTAIGTVYIILGPCTTITWFSFPFRILLPLGKAPLFFPILIN
jgi:MFS superfamily sulfate permease-like transporter